MAIRLHAGFLCPWPLALMASSFSLPVTPMVTERRPCGYPGKLPSVNEGSALAHAKCFTPLSRRSFMVANPGLQPQDTAFQGKVRAALHARAVHLVVRATRVPTRAA
ncbi:hypothetical protein BDU57DRAFT_523405 [Ampelomyces quisqualis]|uniref:Secreted protein n=1 Tax=Ampelomyces quisqualis TaxID=50730 RepID=A0A6A5QB44_AMPQU|nr:hypothetical protein BDU57DRAFT_523405 [Ampelomyces quisqualis]